MKNRIIFMSVLAVMALYATAGRVQATDTLVTETVKYHMRSNLAECTITIDAPKKSDNDMAYSINSSMHQWLGSFQLGLVEDMTTAIDKKFIDAMGKKKYDEMCADVKADYGNRAPTAPYSYDAEIRKIYENDKLITYSVLISTYSGGAHPLTYYAGETFSKVLNGGTLHNNIFTEVGNKTLKTLIKDGLKEYFNVVTDGELVGKLLNIDDVNDIPLPASAPFCTDKGLTFVYGQYEIAPYSEGMPTVVIPYAKARRLLQNTSLF